MDIEVEKFETKIFKIPEENLQLFTDKINKLAKRAQKLGSDKIDYQVVNKVLEPILDEHGKDTNSFTVFLEIVIMGTAPKLQGWNFIGTLDHNQTPDGIVNILRSVPGKSIPHIYHNVGTNCDHCGKNIYRKDTFIVEKDNEFKQVGRSCLKDFLGHKSPEQIAAYAEWTSHLEDELNDIKEECWHDICIDPVFDRDNIFAWASAAIRERGFISKSAIQNGYSGITTSSVMFSNINPYFKTEHERKEFERLYKVTQIEEDKTTAANTIEWVNNNKQENDFIFNLQQIVKLQYVKGKHFGFIAAAVNSFIKERDKLILEKKQQEQIVNEPLGTNGTRVTFEAEVVNVREYIGKSFNYYDSGIRAIYTMKTKDNKIVIWFSEPGKMEVNTIVTITGTIEKAEYDQYAPFKNCLKTIIKRGKVKK